MTLTKTLQNINKSKEGFFNFDNCFLNVDLIKIGVSYNYRRFGTILNSTIKNKTYLDIKSPICFKLTNAQYFFKNKLIKDYFTLSGQMFIGNYKLAKKNAYNWG